MEAFLTPPTKLSFLVCRDVDIDSASRLGSNFIPYTPRYDGIIVCGPLTTGPHGTPELLAVAQGDIATILGHLENIVCRVLYLPSGRDPLVILRDQQHLTANSCNLYSRHLSITPDLYAVGYTEIIPQDKTIPYSSSSTIGGEYGTSTSTNNNIMMSRRKAAHYDNNNNNTMEELEDVEISTSISSTILKELLLPSQESAMLVLNYHYSHTLNQVLFHMNEDLIQAGVEVCIFCHDASQEDDDESHRLPKSFGQLAIVAPKSLRSGYYNELVLEKDVTTGRWKVTTNETHRIEG
eukprot:gene706-768_t